MFQKYLNSIYVTTDDTRIRDITFTSKFLYLKSFSNVIFSGTISLKEKSYRNTAILKEAFKAGKVNSTKLIPTLFKF